MRLNEGLIRHLSNDDVEKISKSIMDASDAIGESLETIRQVLHDQGPAARSLLISNIIGTDSWGRMASAEGFLFALATNILKTKEK